MPQQKPIPIRIPLELIRRVKEIADQHHSSLNAAFHFVIEQYFTALDRQALFELSNEEGKTVKDIAATPKPESKRSTWHQLKGVSVRRERPEKESK